jgi:hypothetical protein
MSCLYFLYNEHFENFMECLQALQVHIFALCLQESEELGKKQQWWNGEVAHLINN